MSEKKVKIPHHRSNQFTSHFATGVILSGETSDGMRHLIFYADAIGIISETGTQIDGDIYSTSIEKDDLSSFREDKVRVTMNIQSMSKLYELLHGQFGNKDNEQPK